MIITIETKTMGRAWLEYLFQVAQVGELAPDDKETIILADCAVIAMETCRRRDPIVVSHGDPDVIAPYIEKMYSHEELPEMGLTYGSRLFNYEGVDQIQRATDHLSKALSKYYSKMQDK